MWQLYYLLVATLLHFTVVLSSNARCCRDTLNIQIALDRVLQMAHGLTRGRPRGDQRQTQASGHKGAARTPRIDPWKDGKPELSSRRKQAMLLAIEQRVRKWPRAARPFGGAAMEPEARRRAGRTQPFKTLRSASAAPGLPLAFVQPCSSPPAGTS